MFEPLDMKPLKVKQGIKMCWDVYVQENTVFGFVNGCGLSSTWIRMVQFLNVNLPTPLFPLFSLCINIIFAGIFSIKDVKVELFEKQIDDYRSLKKYMDIMVMGKALPQNYMMRGQSLLPVLSNIITCSILVTDSKSSY